MKNKFENVNTANRIKGYDIKALLKVVELLESKEISPMHLKDLLTIYEKGLKNGFHMATTHVRRALNEISDEGNDYGGKNKTN